MNTVSALSNLFEAPADLSLFSVSHGHTYYKPPQPSARQALIGHAQRSREGSVVPESQGSATEKAATAEAQGDTDGGARTAWEALKMTVKYGKEYSDDMPLVGEPGNFRFSKSKDAAAAISQSKVQPKAASPSAATPGSRAASVVVPVSSTSPAAKGVKIGEKTMAGSDTTAKAKRRKSKVDGGSP